ncbi:WD and tetratricopeptide repeats protein 1-like [Acyrthosiphon pisum]|uniref:WD repeat-containing protein 55 homolog n=1 Tax=Acyrthosiphon pisum TaxID=7029 RepID=A0A8R2H537_ACYPI|nr:WD and tetratricopeptide repeats protein 1-like [Acyrthosiphon pisum]|eukprot:XP_016657697.1 PREDICTED: WD and tetratricopeptide repeats protein 1-like [Acyrthosiphon pisum]
MDEQIISQMLDSDFDEFDNVDVPRHSSEVDSQSVRRNLLSKNINKVQDQIFDDIVQGNYIIDDISHISDSDLDEEPTQTVRNTGRLRKTPQQDYDNPRYILASACNYHRVILWDPLLQKVITTIETEHGSGIFSVKFIPGCNNDTLVTGSADWSSHTYDVPTGQILSRCTCHQGKINSLAVSNDSPFLYWCASEDGCISQLDRRESHECHIEKSKITLVTIYDNLGKKIEAKCLDINQDKTEQLAVGANDQYVRLYDLRMIQSLSSFDVKRPSEYVSLYGGNNVNNALQYFVPGHIHSNDNETKKQKNMLFLI